MTPDERDAIILTRDEAIGTAPSDLPPAGHERDELLRLRQDELEAKIDALSNHLDLASIDPKVFKKDREIQHEIRNTDGLQVEGALETHMYSWVNYNTQHGLKVWQKKAIGWEVVSSDMPECKNLAREDGTRRIGDVLLMRIPKDLHLALEMKAAEVRRAREFGVDAELRDIASKHKDAVTYHGEIGNAADFKTQRMLGAQKVASQQLNTMIKNGTVPGLGKGGA